MFMVKRKPLISQNSQAPDEVVDTSYVAECILHIQTRACPLLRPIWVNRLWYIHFREPAPETMSNRLRDLTWWWETSHASQCKLYKTQVQWLAASTFLSHLFVLEHLCTASYPLLRTRHLICNIWKEAFMYGVDTYYSLWKPFGLGDLYNINV